MNNHWLMLNWSSDSIKVKSYDTVAYSLLRKSKLSIINDTSCFELTFDQSQKERLFSNIMEICDESLDFNIYTNDKKNVYDVEAIKEKKANAVIVINGNCNIADFTFVFK